MSSPALPTGGSAAPRAVFLSYAREDADAARRIADALRSFGVEVWFDQSELRGGDAWDQKIRGQIRECSIFMPVISSRTQERGEGYFRLEWKLAVERTHLMAEGVPFLAPVAVDDTSDSAAAVPAEFLKVQWTRLPGGLPTPQFVEQTKRLLAAPRGASTAGKPGPSAPPIPPPGGKRAGLPAWMWATAFAFAIAAGIVVFLTRGRPGPEAGKSPAEAGPAPAVVPRAEMPAELPPDKSIAVLPFENMSPDKENQFFADGIQEDILTDLSLIRELRVISRTSVQEYRGTTKKIPQIARELGVSYILEGSVRREGNAVRVTGQLIDARTESHIWAEKYDRELRDIFSVQSEVAQAIADKLQTALSPQDRALLDRRPTENVAAYDLYLRARAALAETDGIGADGGARAGAALEEAVRLDPAFAAAWAQLSFSHSIAYSLLWDHTPERLAKAKAAIDAAVRLAPDDPEVIEMLGNYYYYTHRDYPRAQEQYQRLLQIRPSSADAYALLGQMLRREGRWAEALADFRRSLQLDPNNISALQNLASYLGYLMRTDESIEIRRRAVDLTSGSLIEVYYMVGQSFYGRGSTRETDAWLSNLKPSAEDADAALFIRRAWARLHGDWAEALRIDRARPYIGTIDGRKWQEDRNQVMDLVGAGDMPAAKAKAAPVISEFRALLAADTNNAELWAALADVTAASGDPKEALRCATKGTELAPESVDTVAAGKAGVTLAYILAWAGEKDRSLVELTRLLRTPYGANVFKVRYGPEWIPLRGDPRFEAILNDPKYREPLL